MQAHPALVLNADFRPLSYFPLSFCHGRTRSRRCSRITSPYVRRVRQMGVSSPSTKMRLPSVVALRDYVPMPKRVAFTRFNVFLPRSLPLSILRRNVPAKDLHVRARRPRSKGGTTSWTNIVAACDPCNVKKDNRSTCGRSARRSFRRRASCWRRRSASRRTICTSSWLDFLYWDTEIEP